MIPGALEPRAGHPVTGATRAAVPPGQQVVAAQGAVLDRVLDGRSRTMSSGLERQAYGRFHAARTKTPWGERGQRTFALVEGETILASAERYSLAGVLDGRAVQVCGIGSLWTGPSGRGVGHAQRLIDALLDTAAADGAEIALLFRQAGADDDGRNEFHDLPLTDLTLRVTESSRRGAPMTMMRGGEERDLAAIAAMGRVRAGPFRLHLDRDIDFVRYAITTKRLLAGLWSTNSRQLQFFIAEEGITAAAYVIVSVVGDTWTLEECGDRDATGARVGALLQALIAREPAERRPTIHTWLPPHFLPPQVTIASASPSIGTVGVRMLGSRAIAPPLSADDVLYWRNDVF
jgi:GNAT superfamily N-acetyltransferase